MQVSQPTKVAATQNIQLSSGSTPYRYWLVWITDLGGRSSLGIDEVVLYKQRAG